MSVTVLCGHWIEILRAMTARRFQTCVTSPPYYRQRRYLPADHPRVAVELGRSEQTVGEYVLALVEGLREIRRVLTDDGTLWLNLGDTYSSGGLGGGGSFMALRGDRQWKGKADERGCRAEPGIAEKQLLGVPWRVALALQDDGWWLRSEIIWHKPNCMPSSVSDRPTTAHEHLFLLAKGRRYFFDVDAVREPHTMRPQRRPSGHAPLKKQGVPAQTYSTTVRDHVGVDGHPAGRNTRTVWTIPTESSGTEHIAPMPRELARRCVLAGSRIGDDIIDPFGGSGTLAVVGEQEGRNTTLIDLDNAACEAARRRTAQTGLFGRGAA